MQFLSAATLFVKAGFAPWSAIAKLGDETRKFPREDLRGKFKCSAIDISLINDVFTHYENEMPHRIDSKCRREPPYEEVIIPQNMERCAIDLSKLAGFLIQGRDVANVFSKEFYEASKKEPPYTPFVSPKLHEKPWVVPMQSHEKASNYWGGSVARKSRDPSQQVSPQAWILYLLRFILTGDLCNAWKAFGGLAAQLSHISIALHLGIAENAAFAIAYDSDLRNRIQRLARRRDATLDFGKILSEENDEVKRYLRPLDL